MLTRLIIRSLTGPGLTALALLVLAGLLLQLAALLLGAAVVPSPGVIMAVLPRLLPAVLELTLPVAFLVGLMVGFGRWREEGTWIALRAAGVGGRRLLGPTLALGLAMGLLTGLCAHQLAPQGRRAAARQLAAAASAVELVPGRFLQLGDTVLHRPDEGGLLLAQGDAVLLAQEADLEQREGGLQLRLGQGRLLSRGADGLELSFERASVPLPLHQAGRRVELTERSGAELADLVERMRAQGRDPSYEHSILLKRTSATLLPLLLALLALPLALRWGGRPGHIMGVVLATWALQRIGDAGCLLLGPGLAAGLPALGLAALSALLWAGWRDR